ncbi:hypothetical protein AXE80_10540 [Wenyingzhuangia fucanilytica]|uniref:Uncharacterized protein n=1 Tax=Wenyingzhuangia fucanilytica TaxID=1790137 RepID=A0A1B1Y7B7_9FLAO|nr:hypothetical protein [Wenyingzhuangia fucanilytica]ANW96681.1 hypothetical protein AXE80_10540 [Wenyingzhuangia fucanilytica]
MNEILEILKYTIPSIITAGVAAYFLKQYVHLENNKRKFEMLNDKKKQSLPIRLQAYERMTLFLERINLKSLPYRVEPDGINKIEYAKLLITQINAEFEHNLVQQIYISNDCWKLIVNTKTTVLNNITAYSMQDNLVSGKDLQQELIKIGSEGESPIQITQQYIQKEVQSIL